MRQSMYLHSLPLGFLLLGSCGGAPTIVNAPSEPVRPAALPARPDDGPAAAPARGYPPSYPAPSEAVLADRESAANTKNVGWDVELNPLGLLSTARFAGSGGQTLTDEDRVR